MAKTLFSKWQSYLLKNLQTEAYINHKCVTNTDLLTVSRVTPSHPTKKRSWLLTTLIGFANFKNHVQIFVLHFLFNSVVKYVYIIMWSCSSYCLLRDMHKYITVYRSITEVCEACSKFESVMNSNNYGKQFQIITHSKY